MDTKVYRAGRDDYDPRRRRGRGNPKRILLAVFVLVVLVALVYFFLPIAGQRAVLLGSDARADEASRSDTIMVAKSNGGLLAVPRDTLVEVPGVGEDKLNAAFAYGGPELAVETLEEFTDLRINNYAVIDFGGVEEIVDSLGGITIGVEQPIAYSMDGEYVEIPAGTQTLNGVQALGYVRYRGGPDADIGRIGRQQKFLGALVREAISPSKLPSLPRTIRAVWRNVDTNMNPVESARFAVQMWLWGGGVEIYPGVPQYIDGVAYWVPDTEAGPQVVEGTIR